MKNVFRLFLSIAILVASTSCGGKKGDDGSENLTPLQSQAVAYVRTHLEKGDKLMEAQVVEQPMPAALIEQPFLNLRNTIYKAGLDYKSCQTRGLESAMQMQANKIAEAREQILQTEEVLKQNIGTTNSVIVLAKIKSKKSRSGEPQSLIVVFDSQTMEMKEWIPVTTPVQNTVAMVLCAQDNTLQEYAIEQNHDTSLLASKTDNPVLKFVLDAYPL